MNGCGGVMKKRLVSILLILMYVVCILPNNVYAEEIIKVNNSVISQRNSSNISKNNLLGAWEGTYDGVQNDSTIKRKLRLDISNCSDDGDISGYATIDQGDNGKYYFEGSVDLASGELKFEGNEWMNNPKGFNFAEFVGVLNFAEKTMKGVLDADSSRTFFLSKISQDHTSYSLDFQKMSRDYSGEYDGYHHNFTVRRNIEIHIKEISNSGEISGIAVISPSSKVDSAYGANGSYYFSGSLQKNSGKIELQGYKWIDYPVQHDNFSFISFSGYLDANKGVIIGTTENGIWAMEKMDFSKTDTASGFTLGVNNNRFVHSSSSSWDGAGFVGVSDYSISDEYFNKLTAHSSKSEKNKIKKLMSQSWEGSCYGIAMSMGLLYEGYIGIRDLTDETSAKNYHSMSLPCNNSKLLNMINYYQLSQNLEVGGQDKASISAAYNNGWFTGLANWLCSYDSLSVFLKKLVNYSSTNHVELLGFSSSSGGHAVLVTGCEFDKNIEQYRVQIYDENSVNSATSNGTFSYMYIAKDFSSFSYTDSNGDILNENTYVAIYFLDWNALGNIVSTTKRTSSSHSKLDFLLGPEFKVVNAEGRYIQYSNSSFTGDMNIYGVSTVDTDKGVHIIIETDDTAYVTLSNLDSKVDVEFYNDANYLAVQGKNLDGAKLTLGDGIELQGDSYSFSAYVGMNKLDDNEDGLLSVSAYANSNASIAKRGNELEVKANKTLTNITATDYVGTKIDKRKFENTSDLNVSSVAKKEKSTPTISLNKTKYLYNGKVQKPSVIVKDSRGNKVHKSNYKVAYSKGCKAVGKYTVEINLKDNYTGKITKSFEIVPKGTSIFQTTARSKGFVVSWKRQATQTTGYQIQYSSNSKFSSAKIITVAKSRTVSRVIAKLKGNKKYYVRIRTYKMSKGKKYYSPWSKEKKIVTRK